MKIIFYDKDGKELSESGGGLGQNEYCLTHDGEIACWDESQGWTTEYCEGMTYKIEDETKGLSDEQINKLKQDCGFKHNTLFNKGFCVGESNGYAGCFGVLIKPQHYHSKVDLVFEFGAIKDAVKKLISFLNFETIRKIGENKLTLQEIEDKIKEIFGGEFTE